MRSGAPKNRLNRFGFKALVALTLAALGAVMMPAAAQAVPVVSQAEGRLLTASIAGVDSAPLLALNGATAINPFGTGNVVANVPPNATALGLLGLTVAPGVNLFGTPGIVQLGAVGQYAAANDDGSSVAFSGTVSEASSLIGVGTVTSGSNVGTPGAGDSATISVGTAQLLGGTNLVALDIGIGAVAASAQQPVAGAATGNYTIANLDVTVGGTLLATTIGTLDLAITPVLTAVNALIGVPIPDPLTGGTITVTLADLLAAAGVANINLLPPGTNLLTYLPAAVTAKLTTVVNTLLGTLQTAITGLGLGGIAVGILLGVAQTAVAGILSGITATLATPVNALAQLNVNNKTTNPDGSFTQNALTIGLGTAGALARVRLANATVGPNAGPGGIPPFITNLAPNNGPETGNTLVTITGGAFTGATGVTFDGLPGTNFTVVNDSVITVRTPAHVPAAVNVVILHPNGPSVPGVFTYTPLIAVTDIDPNFGPTAGGTPVDIFGSCFTGATGVTFGGIPGTGFTVVNDGHITVTAPAHAAGAVDVVVVGAAACGGSVTVPNGYTYVSPAAPLITGLVPDNGPESGGTAVTVTGSGFTGATGVTFDGLPGTSFSVVNDTTILVTSPAHAPAIVGVVVVHPPENSGPFDFTYTPLIAVTDIDPDFGPAAGGTVVTITGECLTGATGVLFDGVAGTSFSVTAGVITVTTPAGIPGYVDVTVQGSVSCGGDEVVPDGFQYISATAPVLTDLDPDNGPQTGGTVVTITGTGFTGATGVTFDGLPGTAFSVVNPTTILVTSPPHAPGVVDVVVLHPNGPSAPLDFTFLPATTITTVTPPSGPEAGGTVVTILGSCFTGATGVLFGSTAAASFIVVSDTEIRATTRAGVGVVDVTVVGTPSCGTAVADDGFRFVAAAVALTGMTFVPTLLLAVQLLLVGLVLALVQKVGNRRVTA